MTLSEWDRMTRGQQETHRQTCERGCGVCEGHRHGCYSCGHDIDPDDETCESCGTKAPASIDWGTR